MRAVPMLDRDNSGLVPTWGATLIGATIKVCAGLSCSLVPLAGKDKAARLSLDLAPMRAGAKEPLERTGNEIKEQGSERKCRLKSRVGWHPCGIDRAFEPQGRLFAVR